MDFSRLVVGVAVVAALCLLQGIASADDGVRAAIGAGPESGRAGSGGTAGGAGLDAGPVDYATLDGRPVAGYLARPAGADDALPALVVIHDRWGLDEAVRALTRRLAVAGYVALAVDLYRGRTATGPARARRLMRQAMASGGKLQQNLRQAFFHLEVMPSTARIGSIGRCTGGDWSLRAAMLLPRALDAAVVYDSRGVTDRDALAALRVPIQAHFGARDRGSPRARALSFERILTELDKRHEVHAYDDAGGDCASPAGGQYREDAEALAWERTLEFLESTLRPWSEPPGRDARAARAAHGGRGTLAADQGS